MSCYILIGNDVGHKQWWNGLVSAYAVIGEPFEIHCWQDEKETVQLPMAYGREDKVAWRGGTVIRGKITREFLNFLIRMPKPADTDIYNKMSPFFTIRFGDCLCSEHYGTEMILTKVTREKQSAVEQISKELDAFGTVHHTLD